MAEPFSYGLRSRACVAQGSSIPSRPPSDHLQCCALVGLWRTNGGRSASGPASGAVAQGDAGYDFAECGLAGSLMVAEAGRVDCAVIALHLLAVALLAKDRTNGIGVLGGAGYASADGQMTITWHSLRLDSAKG